MSWFESVAYAATEAAGHAAEHAEAAHGAGHGGHGDGPSLHVLNLVSLIEQTVHGPIAEAATRYQNLFFGLVVIAVIAYIFGKAANKTAIVPGRLQSVCESIVEALLGFVAGILGKHEARRYAPFLGTVFLYILTMNLIGLVPLLHAPTANSMMLTAGGITLPIPTTTGALAVVVFLYVQYIGITRQGIVGYLDHMAGTPRDAFGWVLSPLMFVLHVIGEFAKPLSLAFRLYGNISGEHVLLAVFIGLGIGTLSFLPVPGGLPLHFPFLLLSIMMGAIQAFVFTLLSTVYIAMMLPHGDHEHEEHGHGKTGHHPAKAAH